MSEEFYLVPVLLLSYIAAGTFYFFMNLAKPEVFDIIAIQFKKPAAAVFAVITFILTWPMFNGASEPTPNYVQHKVQTVQATSGRLRRLFTYVLVAVPVWSVFFAIFYTIGLFWEPDGWIFYLFSLGIIVVPFLLTIIPFVGFFVMFFVGIAISIAWLVWLPVVLCLTPKVKI